MFRFVWRLMFSFGRFWVSSSRFTTWPFTFIRNTYQKRFYLWNQIFLSSLGCHLQLDCSSSVSSVTRDSHAKNSVSTKRFEPFVGAVPCSLIPVQKTAWSYYYLDFSDQFGPIVNWYDTFCRSKPIDKSNFAETLSDFSHHLTVNVRYLHPVTLIRRYYSDFRSNPSGLPSSCRSDSLLNAFYLPV